MTKFGAPPYGWEFDIVRLFVVCLLRSGTIEALSQGKTITSATSPDAQATFPGNNHFRQATFRPQDQGADPEVLVDAAENLKASFGEEIRELSQAVAANAIRSRVGEVEEGVREARGLLQRWGLPGTERLSDAQEPLREIRKARDPRVIQTFNDTHKLLREADERSRELLGALHQGALEELKAARRTLEVHWPVIRGEPDLDQAVVQDAEVLSDLLRRETFFREIAEVGRRARTIRDTHDAAWTAAANARKEAYEQAVQELTRTPGWADLTGEQQGDVATPLRERARDPAPDASIHLLREAVIACQTRLAAAREQVAELTSGERVVRIDAVSFFAGGIDSEEQLERVLEGLREHCVKELGQGRRIVFG